MTEQSPRRARPILVAASVVVLLAAGITTWALTSSSEQPGFCAELSADPLVERALGTTAEPESDCATVGTSLKAAATSDKPRVHSLREAQAMQDTLNAVADLLATRKDTTVDEALRLPLAQLIADYTSDTHAILEALDADYVRNLDEPWQDDNGVHMAVTGDVLVRVVRAVSTDPAAYATVRRASTEFAAERLAKVPATAEGVALTVPPMGNARVFGSLDAVAADVTKELGKEKGTSWQVSVFSELTEANTTPPAYAGDPAEHIAETWLTTLHAAGAGSSATQLQGQSVKMTEIWAKAAGVETSAMNELLEKNGNDDDEAYSDVTRTLEKL